MGRLLGKEPLGAIWRVVQKAYPGLMMNCYGTLPRTVKGLLDEWINIDAPILMKAFQALKGENPACPVLSVIPFKCSRQINLSRVRAISWGGCLKSRIRLTGDPFRGKAVAGSGGLVACRFAADTKGYSSVSSSGCFVEREPD